MLLQKNWCLSRLFKFTQNARKIYEFIHDEGLRLQKGSFGQELIEKTSIFLITFMNY